MIEKFNAKQFRDTRRSWKVRQWDLTQSTGIWQSTISLIENGYVKPSHEQAVKLERALKRLIEQYGN